MGNAAISLQNAGRTSIQVSAGRVTLATLRLSELDLQITDVDGKPLTTATGATATRLIGTEESGVRYSFARGNSSPVLPGRYRISGMNGVQEVVDVGVAQYKKLTLRLGRVLFQADGQNMEDTTDQRLMIRRSVGDHSVWLGAPVSGRADLAPGLYTITAIQGETSRTSTVRVEADKTAVLSFEFKE
jgi:hypothetical protein